MTVFPNDFLSLKLDNPAKYTPVCNVVAVEPRVNSKVFSSSRWPEAQTVSVVDNEIRLLNRTNQPIFIPKNEHLCQIRATKIIDTKTIPIFHEHKKPAVLPTPKIMPPFSKHINTDPDNQLSQEWKSKFMDLHLHFDSVFEPVIGRYNDKSGRIRARITFGPVLPPTTKLHAPCYGRDNLQLLQQKCDELEGQGALARPEDVGVVVQHVSASFLVKKSSGVGHRLVTAFTSLGEYIKPLPSLMPTVEVTLRTISEWKYLISTDLRDAFYQIPLEKSSMGWCAIQTPFKGLRVYCVACQGLPGSSEWLEELLSLLFGSMIQDGWVAKVADDLYIGGNSFDHLFDNWSQVLDILFQNGMKLKGIKTFIVPMHMQILGWDWQNGSISASSHKLLPLIKCDPPETVTLLRSYIGAYKVFNRIVRGCAANLEDLEKLIAGKNKNDKLVWTEPITQSFRASQSALSSATTITLPRRSDQLIIVHDGSQLGVGSVLYLKRNETIKLGSYFSAKLKTHQALWYPCEIEALSIAVSVSHFGPHIRDSLHRTQILTDSRPCVQAWGKMRRGQFSTSARVATFMSTLSQFNVEVQHISGKLNLPSDFLSRNPPSCLSRSCQVCKFIDDSDSVVVRHISVQEVLAGHKSVPFGNRVAWKSLQMECHDLRRVHAHLTSGTRPTAKNTKVGVVKKFLRNVKIARDGLLVVKQAQAFLPETELIVVPLDILHGLVTSLHLSLNHPTMHQLTNVFNRCYYSLKVADCISSVTKSCSQCQALQTIPAELHAQSSTKPPTVPLNEFSADVMRRCKQFILAIRDTFSSYTSASLMTDEQHGTLRKHLIIMISALRPNPQTKAMVRVDNAPGFGPLREDQTLSSHQIVLDFGRKHNKNKNPTIEKGIRELGSEIIRLLPEGGPISSEQLAVVVNQLNSRIRNRGLSAWEILCQRNQYTGEQIDLNDLNLSEQQAQLRIANQEYSSKHKSGGNPPATEANITVGSLVYIKSEGDKTRARDRYLVVSVNEGCCDVRKFVKSQLRAKRYQLKLTEVYPVPPERIEIPGDIRGLEPAEFEEDNIHERTSENQMNPDPTVDVGQSYVVPVLAEHHSAGVVDEESREEGIRDSVPDSDNVDEPPVIEAPVEIPVVETPAVVHSTSGPHMATSRRSGRQLSKPAWMQSGEYDMEK